MGYKQSQEKRENYMRNENESNERDERERVMKWIQSPMERCYG